MDHRSVTNILAFIVAMILTMWAGVAFSIPPETWYRITQVGGGGISFSYGASQYSGCIGERAPNEADLETFFEACIPNTVIAPTGNYNAVKNGRTTSCDTENRTCTYLYDAINKTGGSDITDGGGTLLGITQAVPTCWNGTDPVNNDCPENPQCAETVGVEKNWTGPGESPASVCLSNCLWNRVGLGVYLPTANTYYIQIQGTGDTCSAASTGTAPIPTPTPITDPAPTTTNNTTTTAPETTGDTTTTTTTNTTNTTPEGTTTVTNTTVTHTLTGGTNITKTTTTTTTTHADGSTTTTVTTDYNQTVGDTTTTVMGPGGPTTTVDSGYTRNGSTSETTNSNPDGSSSTTTTHEGVGGDGQSGPEAGQGGDGDCVGAECGDGDPCGEFIPQHICDWFQEPELDQTPVGLPEITTDPGSYDSGLGTGTCPGSITVALGQFGTHSVSLQPICDFALSIRPFVIAIAYLMAAFIVVGGRGK